MHENNTMPQWEDLPGGRTVHHFYRNQSTPQLPGLARDCFGTVGKMSVRKCKNNIQENAWWLQKQRVGMALFTSSDKKAGSPIEAFAQGPMLSMLSQTCIKAQFGSHEKWKKKTLGYGAYIDR